MCNFIIEVRLAAIYTEDKARSIGITFCTDPNKKMHGFDLYICTLFTCMVNLIMSIQCNKEHMKIQRTSLTQDSSDSHLVQEELQVRSLQLLDHSLRLQAAHTHTQ